jgi:hypothetical protein
MPAEMIVSKKIFEIVKMVKPLIRVRDAKILAK